MKNICVIIPYSYPVPAILGGAVETLVQFLIDENEKAPSFQFTILATYSKKNENVQASYKRAEFIYYKPRKLLDPIWFFVFRAIKKVFRIYIPFSPRFVSILRHLKREGGRYDYVLFESGLTYMLPLVAKVYPQERILNHIHWPGDGNKKIDKSFAYLLSVSHFCAEEWKKATTRKDDKIFVWNNGYNDYFFQKRISRSEKENLYKELKLSETDDILIYVGRIIPEKGIKELLEALQRLHNEKLVLLLIGKANFGLDKTTAFEKEINSMIQKGSIRVIQTGFVSNEYLYKYYGISTLAVMPTLIDESAGMVNIEAMASGVPLITTDKGAVKEYVDNAAVVLDTGSDFVDKLADAINDLLLHSEKRERMIQDGLKRACYFAKAEYFKRFISIIDNIERQEQRIKK